MKQITVQAVSGNCEAVIEFVNASLSELGCAEKVRMQLDIAVDELFGNITRYAYAPGTGDATVCVESSNDGAAVTVTFIDSGVPYNPLEHPDPDTGLSAEERGIGGLGIFMVKKITDKLEYEYTQGKNILRVTKNL